MRAVSFVWFLLLATTARAVDVRVRLHEPPPGQVNVEDLWWVDIDNRDGSTYARVYLHGEVRERERGLVYRANSNEFDLPPGRTTKRLRDIRLRDQWYLPGYEVFVTRTGEIPPGDYTRSVTLVPLGVGDSGRLKPGARVTLRLLAPRDGAAVAERYPLFSWSAAPPARDCELTVAQILEGQTREEALRANRPWFRQEDIAIGSLRYPVSGRQFETGQRYAWQVRSFVGGVVTGESPVGSFAFGETARMLTREQVAAIVLKQVIRPESLDHDVIAFLGRAPLGPADTLAEASDSPRQKTFSRLTWFAWVNDRPLAYFAHPTRYVFVDAHTGELSVETRSWWPSLNRNWLWVTPEEMSGDRYVIFLESKGGGR